jgi:hypothetical protein
VHNGSCIFGVLGFLSLFAGLSISPYPLGLLRIFRWGIAPAFTFQWCLSFLTFSLFLSGWKVRGSRIRRLREENIDQFIEISLGFNNQSKKEPITK